MASTRKSLLLILDGLGLPADELRSAVTPTTMPNFFALAEQYGCARLEASGPAVGLGEGEVGNSEIGHLTIGAGRRVLSTLERVRAASRNGTWKVNPAWRSVRSSPRLHIVGLLSDAGVHAHWSTVAQAAQLAAHHRVAEILLHLLLDGVDSAAGSAPALLQQLKAAVADVPGVRLATISGRRWALDRSGKRELSEQARAGLRGELPMQAFSQERLEAHLARHDAESDFPCHFVPGGRFVANGEPVLITSHRADRASQLAAVLAEHGPVYAMIDLKGDAVPAERIFFEQQPITGGLVDALRHHGLEALRIAEDCKFPHVTWFVNGLRTFDDTPTIRIPSIPESDIAHHPEMSLDALRAAVLTELASGKHRAMIVNIPNLDQVGHTGQKALAEEAARMVDATLSEIADACRANGWSLVISADHGNADCMVTQDGRPLSSHSPNPVPLLVLEHGSASRRLQSQDGSLVSVASVYLRTLGLELSRRDDTMSESGRAANTSISSR
jgi:2,3-bisphosphoglycerate-independent phosphoglycerate mutase